MTQQPALFDLGNAHKLARRDDPETSKDAALHVAPKLGELHQAILAELRRCKGFGMAPTARELGVALKREAWRRMGELEALGLVERLAARTCAITGRQAATWRVKE